jgi:dienelactone hydrolase
MPISTTRPRWHHALLAAASTTFAAAAAAQTPPAVPAGEIQGTAWEHTAESLAGTVRQARLCLPAAATGGAPFCGWLQDAPKTTGARVPVVVFLHGSSGLALKAIGEWQQWLASLGWASLAPDSFALAGHVTYKSPIDKASYERILALRASEIAPAIEAVKAQAWADVSRLVLAGTSEGAVPVARHAGTDVAARLVYAWSCEANYFVDAPRTAVRVGQPVLNVISTTDPFFSRSNPWLGNADAAGHCAAALKDEPRSAVVLVPGAPHTLLNLPATRFATAGFLAALTAGERRP